MADELIIPIRMDTSKAAADLRALSQQGRRAADAIAKGAKDASDGVDRIGESAKGAGSEIASLIKTAAGVAAFKQVASTIGDEWRRVAEEIGRASKEFQAFRASLQGVAALSSKPNSNEFAAAEIDRAERARVTPQEAQRFREAFLAKGSLYVGNGPDAKLSDEEAGVFQEKLMEYAKDKGVSMEEMAGFGGGLLAQQRGRTTAKEMIARAGKVFGGLEASSAPVAHLLPMTTRAMAQGFSAEESAMTLGMMPEIAPEEEGTYLLRAVSALRDRVQKGQGEEFGLKKGMTPYQILTTAIGNIQARAARGEDLDDLIAKASHGEEVAGKALRGMVGQGEEGFARWRRVVESIPEDQVRKTIEETRKSDAGRQYAVDSRLAVEKARMGMRNDTVERRRQIAEAELTAGGRFEHPLAMDYAKALLPLTDDMRTQQINRQMIARARAELGESGGVGDTVASYNRGMTDDLMRTLIRRIEDQTAEQKKQTRLLQEQAQPARPLVVPPMVAGGRRM